MRYRMLHNEWRYATNSAQFACRRLYIRQAFDGIVPSSEPCGFCDLCQPDLAFRRERAAVSPTDATLQQLSQLLAEEISRFDFEALITLIDAFVEHQALEGLQLHAERLLETAPQNQAILFVAAEAAARRGLTGDALRHFTETFRLNEEAPRDVDRARRLYERMRLVDSVAAVQLIDRWGGIFDTVDGRRFRRNELARTLGAEHPRVRDLDAFLTCDAIGLHLPPTLLAVARTHIRATLRSLG
jgi:hypothetical protein